ncbi:hypothetical protein HYZ97_00610 [Candidatus Pacearchaeota archaeon]|nr:hypothetical protein [Candidatus Pacearchaeota archaeon]
MDSLAHFIEKIREKAELQSLAEEVIRDQLKIYCKMHQLSSESLVVFSPAEQRLVVKEVRAELRKLTGRFNVSQKNRSDVLESLDKEAILRTHSSTRERYESYPLLREYLASLKPHSILDLGCGLNPLALAHPKINYYASDIQEDELAIIKRFFAKNNISGKTFIYDLRKIDDSLPRADVALLLKVLDVLEQRGHKLAERIIEKVPAQNLLVSFSTKTLSGKPMNHPQRGWIEQLVKRKGYTFKLLKLKNELVYHITK